MKKVFITCLTLTILHFSMPSYVLPSDDWVSLLSLKKEIQSALFFAQLKASAPPYFLVTKIELSLNVSDTTGAGGGIKIPVLPINAGVAGEGTSTNFEQLALTLVPITQTPVSASLRIGFLKALEDVKKAFREERASTGFIITDFNYTRKFQLRRTGGAKLEFYIVEGKVEKNKEYTHSITIKMCETRNKKNCASSQ